MNSVLDVMRAHRSVRHFTEDPVPDHELRQAVSAAQCASTSSAIQAYRVLRVTDPGQRARLVELTGDQPMVAACGAFLVIAGDTQRHRLACDDADEAYDARLEAFLLATIDASLFAQNLALALESMGYGICCVGGLRNRLAEVDDLLRIPTGLYPLFGLCIGRPAHRGTTRPRLAPEAVLNVGTWASETSVRAGMAEYDERYRAYRRDRGVPPLGWAELVGRKFTQPQRTDLAAYYASKGADLG